MGGYGVTEDCPGFLGQKWMDAQLEATYEGPEAVQRLQLSITMTNELFLAQFKQWIAEMRALAGERPGTGACTLASAMQLWLWTLNHVQTATDADGAKLLPQDAPGRDVPAGRRAVLAAGRAAVHPRRGRNWKRRARKIPRWPTGWPARWISSTTSPCAMRPRRRRSRPHLRRDLVHGYNRHPAWDETSCHACYCAEELESLEGLIPGIDGSARAYSDVAETGEDHPCKAGPCVKFCRPGRLRPPARQARRLPHRLPPGQRPRRRSADQSDDARSAGLSGLISRKAAKAQRKLPWRLCVFA